MNRVYTLFGKPLADDLVPGALEHYGLPPAWQPEDFARFVERHASVLPLRVLECLHDDFRPGGIVRIPKPTIYAQPRKAECDGCGAPLGLLSRCEYCRRPA